MQLVTLLTDLGTKDHYVGLIKGKLLSAGVPLQLIDLSHEIESYNILQAAFLLKNCYRAFPPKTLHLISVFAAYAPERRYLALAKDGHYFVAPDNGFFSLLFHDDKPQQVIELPQPKSRGPLEIEQVFANVLHHLHWYGGLDGLGKPSNQYQERLSLQPIVLKDQIRGSIIHIDQYENIVVNIQRELFDRIGRGRPFELYYKRFDPLTELSSHYTDVSPGDTLCLFNSTGFLEIAVHLGQAATLYGLSVDDAVQIIFHDE